MGVISSKIIRKPRKQRHCERCGELIEGEQLRLYGRAHRGDPAYAIYHHTDPQTCIANESARWDRLAAVNRAAEQRNALAL